MSSGNTRHLRSISVRSHGRRRVDESEATACHRVWPVIQPARRRTHQQRGHPLTNIVAAMQRARIHNWSRQPVSSLDARPAKCLDLLTCKPPDAIFKLQLDGSSSADHPNVPDAEPHLYCLGGPDRVESTGCQDLGGCDRCDSGPRSFEPPSAMKSLRTGSAAPSRIA
jgi:hypothetical protein